MNGNSFSNINSTDNQNKMVSMIKPIGNNLGINLYGTIRSSAAVPAREGLSFADELKKAQCEVKFSKHAEMRLRTRNINLSDEQKEKLASAIDRADGKGLRDTLVMLDSLALVANVRSRTIVTAVDSGELTQNVFTNIDGAVFA